MIRYLFNAILILSVLAGTMFVQPLGMATSSLKLSISLPDERSSKQDLPGSPPSVTVQVDHYNATGYPLTGDLARNLNFQVFDGKRPLKPVEEGVSAYPWGKSGSKILIPYKLSFSMNYTIRCQPSSFGYEVEIRAPHGRYSYYKVRSISDVTIVFNAELENQDGKNYSNQTSIALFKLFSPIYLRQFEENSIVIP